MATPRNSLMVDPPPREALPGDEQDPLSDRLARQIRLGILRGDSPAGSRLNLDELKGRYNVSLSPLREALSRLAAEGFVHFEAKRGFRVTEMSRSNLAEIFTIRRLCEPLAVREAVVHGDEEWEERVAAAYHTLGKRSAEKPHAAPSPEWENAHRKFHLAVLSGCGMPMLLHFCSTLMDLQDRYRLQLSRAGTYVRQAGSEHAALFDACTKRDAAKAEKLATQHIDATYQQLAALMPAAAGTPAKQRKRRLAA